MWSNKEEIISIIKEPPGPLPSSAIEVCLNITPDRESGTNFGEGEGPKIPDKNEKKKIFKMDDSIKNLKDKINLDWSKIDISQFKVGLKEELEHKDVTGGDLVLTAKIVLAHLKEDPHYYSKMEKIGLIKDILFLSNVEDNIFEWKSLNSYFIPNEKYWFTLDLALLKTVKVMLKDLINESSMAISKAEMVLLDKKDLILKTLENDDVYKNFQSYKNLIDDLNLAYNNINNMIDTLNKMSLVIQERINEN